MQIIYTYICALERGVKGTGSGQLADSEEGPHRNRGFVYTNWPISAGSWSSCEKTGADVLRPSGVQKPEVVNGVKGFSISSSLTRS